jgi:hypothetical protein
VHKQRQVLQVPCGRSLKRQIHERKHGCTGTRPCLQRRSQTGCHAEGFSAQPFMPTNQREGQPTVCGSLGLRAQTATSCTDSEPRDPRQIRLGLRTGHATKLTQIRCCSGGRQKRGAHCRSGSQRQLQGAAHHCLLHRPLLRPCSPAADGAGRHRCLQEGGEHNVEHLLATRQGCCAHTGPPAHLLGNDVQAWEEQPQQLVQQQQQQQQFAFEGAAMFSEGMSCESC